jgi:hypothetical protein
MATTFAVPDGRVAMNAVLRNGFGASGGSITSLNFQPDFFWEKARNNAYNHQLVDSVRGVANTLNSNLTNAESSQPTYVTSFNSNGYTLGANDYGTGVTLVDWCWKAGGTVTANNNTVGTITSTVSANTTAGFSVVTYTGTGANATVGHGLGVAPSMVIVKRRNSTGNWPVQHTSVSASNVLFLDLTNAQTASTTFQQIYPTASIFYIDGGNANVGANGGTYVAYCWAPVAGYSAFGSYTGNGSTDGPFIYTGFRPRWIMIKAITVATAYSWVVLDSSRNTYNLADSKLLPNSSVVENDAGAIGGAGVNAFDFVSNGFKSRTLNLITNESGTTYIYAAFAENPLKYANAR